MPTLPHAVTEIAEAMSPQDAMREARRRWGASGAVEYRPTKPPGERYAVGTKGGGPNGIAYGVGASYVEAFARASLTERTR